MDSASLTPQLCPHARERCEQMGISTKRAKRVVQRALVSYGDRSRRVVFSDDPDVAVVYNETTRTIVTVLPRVPYRYVRGSGELGHEPVLDSAAPAPF